MERSRNAFLVLRLGSKSFCQLGNNTDMFAAREVSCNILRFAVCPCKENICLRSAIFAYDFICILH